MLDATVAFILFWPSKRDREECSVEEVEGRGKQGKGGRRELPDNGGKEVGRVSTWKE